MTPRLTFFFIVEPPGYQVLACYLAATIKENFGDQAAMVGYCPAHKMDQLDPAVLQVMDRLGVPVRPMQVQGVFDPPYPHGNKMIATLQPRDTEYSCFLDSDILFLRPNSVDNLIRASHVSLTPAASMGWAGQDIWPKIYATCGMEMPAERIRLMRQRNTRDRVPYFSSGLYCFPEHHRNARGETFAQSWMAVAQLIEGDPDIPAKRPYLDQMSLPLAIRRAGLDWNILPEEQHYILGGMTRAEPLPSDRDIFTVHYRTWKIVEEKGLKRYAKNMLDKHAGVRKLKHLAPADDATPVPDLAEADD